MTRTPTPSEAAAAASDAVPAPPGASRRAAVLGAPIAHSLSPVLHRAAYARLGLSGWSYGRHEVDEAGLPGFLAALDVRGEGWAGLSLTMPLKRAVIPLLDAVGPTARAVHAVNTLIFHADGSRSGENTDVPGFVAALRERGVGVGGSGHDAGESSNDAGGSGEGGKRLPSAAVLGGGATASSALAALSELVDGPIAVYARNPSKLADLEPLAEHFAVTLDPRPWTEAADAAQHDLIINTTPAGAADELAASLPEYVGTLFDVIYHPWPTPLAAAWSQRGGTVLGGQDLLVHQAVLQVEMMTGVHGRAPEILAAMREALAEH